MRIVLFYHSLLADWNHGNAHFLRGVVTELLSRGHDVQVYEPQNGWSLRNQLAEFGEQSLRDFRAAYPRLDSHFYDLATLNLNRVLEEADLVLVHEWNEPELVARLGEHHRVHDDYLLLFHDTHHRAVTAEEEMRRYDLRHYDGVLAFGNVLRDLYLARGWTREAWTWHEAADTRVFKPIVREDKIGDLVWIGNWGDEERTAELYEFLLNPVAALGLRATTYGVRYPEHALASLKAAGIAYGNWCPNHASPAVFSRYRVTVHVPRRPYTRALPGIPTIRMFEALACGIPLISAPWHDSEHLFDAGRDYLVARNGTEMVAQLRAVLGDPVFAKQVADHGRRTILSRHTCSHRVDELLSIVGRITGARTQPREVRTCLPA